MITLLPWVVAALIGVGQPVDVEHLCLDRQAFNTQARVFGYDEPNKIAAMATEGVIWFRDRTCHMLNKMSMGGYVQARKAGWHLLIATHEVRHTMGYINETEATCYGLANVKRLARGLNYGRPYKAARKARQWAKLLPQAYRQGC